MSLGFSFPTASTMHKSGEQCVGGEVQWGRTGGEKVIHRASNGRSNKRANIEDTADPVGSLAHSSLMTPENRLWGMLALGMLRVGIFFLTGCERDRCWQSYADPYQREFVRRSEPLQDAIRLYRQKNGSVPHRNLFEDLAPDYLPNIPSPEELGVTSFNYSSVVQWPSDSIWRSSNSEERHLNGRYWLIARVPYGTRSCSFTCVFQDDKFERCDP